MSTRPRQAAGERQVLSAAHRLADRADRILGLAASADLGNLAGAARYTRVASDAALARLNETPGDPTARALLLDAIDCGQDLRPHLSRRQSARRSALRQSLDRLRPIRDPAALVDALCEEALQALGARRAMLSRVDDGLWSPWKAAPSRPDGSAALAWLALEPIAVREMALEGAVAATGTPALVTLPGDGHQVHPALQPVATESHVLAPIAPDGTVIGILHIDRAGEARTVDVDDCELAWAFCAGFGRLFERAVHHRRLEIQRDLVQDIAAHQVRITTADPQITEILPTGRGAATGAPHASGAPQVILTRRELDVADLMAGGLSNVQIGERLVIAPATVKSHVRSILRKLGAANRSHAIGLHSQARRGRTTPRAAPVDRDRDSSSW